MPASVSASLRFAGGVAEAERPNVVGRLGKLDERLRTFDAAQVRLELSVEERGGADQRTTLEAWLSGFPRLVATSRSEDLDTALVEVRDDLVRQISDTKQSREPRSNRHLRVRRDPRRVRPERSASVPTARAGRSERRRFAPCGGA